MTDDERDAEKWVGQLDQYEPTPEIWRALRDYINEITERYQRDYMALEVYERETNAFTGVSRAVALRFLLRKTPTEGEPVVVFAAIPIDDAGYACGFYPADICPL